MPKSLTPLTGGLVPHVIPLMSVTAATAPAAASAAANTEVLSAPKATRVKLDLTNATDFKLEALVVANGSTTTSSIKLSYMLTEAATWAGTDAGPTIVLGTGTAGVIRDSGWVAVPAAMKVASVTVAVLVGAAFGLTAPTVGSLRLHIR